MPGLIIERKNIDPESGDYFMKVGKYLLFGCLTINTGINVSPLKDQVKNTLKMPNTMVSNAIVAFVLISIMCFLAYKVSSIGTVIDLAAGLFGIPMIYIFPTLVCIKCNYYKNTGGKIFLYLWTALWFIFVLINLGMLAGVIKKDDKK